MHTKMTMVELCCLQKKKKDKNKVQKLAAMDSCCGLISMLGFVRPHQLGAASRRVLGSHIINVMENGRVVGCSLT